LSSPQALPGSPAEQTPVRAQGLKIFFAAAGRGAAIMTATAIVIRTILARE
jgi:hypothetical protein